MLVASPVVSSNARANEQKLNEMFPKCLRTRQVTYPCKTFFLIIEFNLNNFFNFSFKFNFIKVSIRLSRTKTITRNVT